MLGWLTEVVASVRAKVRGAIREVKIASDFSRFDEEMWAEYQNEAFRKFDHSPYEQEIDRRMADTVREVRERFDGPIAEIEASNSRSTFEMVRHKRHRDLLSEDHRYRLRRAHDQLNKIKPLLDEAYEDRREGFEMRDEAQGNIDWWYRKSERPLFGNRGKEIPKYAFFGQSQNDLARYKDERDEAYACIRNAKERIAEFKPEKQAVSNAIKQLKERQESARRLRALGLSVEIVTKLISNESANLEALNQQLSEQEVERAAFLMQRKIALGVDVLEAQIVEMHASKKAHLAAFQAHEAKEARQLAHREWWLGAHSTN